VLATPAYVSAELARPLAPDAASALDSIRYVSTGTISLAYRRQDVAHPLDGFGLVIPKSERRSVNAITWSSTKFDGRAPDDAVLMRAFFGGSRTPWMMDQDDDELLAAVRVELQSLLGIAADPLFHRIYRWYRSNPQYDIGHLDLVDAIDAALPPNLYVTGSPYRGVGLPDCIHQAELTAEKIVDGWRRREVAVLDSGRVNDSHGHAVDPSY
jgi:oxygen-dependent protoporphyrinogen oxidase